MTTSPYTEFLRHHYLTQPARRQAGGLQTDRLLAPWRRHQIYHPSTAAPQSR